MESIFFASFPTANIAKVAIKLFRQKAVTYKENIVWCNVGRPVHERVPLRLLFQIKKLLGNWGFQQRCIRVDEKSGIMQVGETPVVQACSTDGKLDVQWLSAEWADWKALQESDELKELLNKCQEDLRVAHERSRKGLGKGKPRSE